jgi:hypothetical protein
MEILKSIPKQSGKKLALFFDLDGTLLSSDKAQFEENIELLRNYCVSEAFNSVHPIGYPINHSTHSGFNRPIFPRGVSSAKLRSNPSYPRLSLSLYVNIL